MFGVIALVGAYVISLYFFGLFCPMIRCFRCAAHRDQSPGGDRSTHPHVQEILASIRSVEFAEPDIDDNTAAKDKVSSKAFELVFFEVLNGSFDVNAKKLHGACTPAVFISLVNT